ncbi:MAG: hypothetical protein C0615_01280 [Desulfuromonas sp.]|nr:MAG: hypothetical protein C0615_01280 [Desulfuromonas sp.]
MKKFIVLMSLVVLVFSLAACGTSTIKVDDQDITLEPIECRWLDAPEIESPAPAWVCDEPVGDGIISAVGIGRATPATNRDPALKKRIAQANGRVQLADQLKIQVQNMFNEASTVTGSTIDDETYDLVTDSVTSQITDQKLSGSRPLKSTISPKGTLYVLMVLDAKTAGKAVEEAIQSSFQNEKALWKIANGERLKNEMDERIAKMKEGN